MVKLNKFISAMANQPRIIHEVMEYVGDVELGQLTLVNLLVVHALIINSEIDYDKTINELLNLINIQIMEHITLISEGAYARSILDREKPYLCLKHIYYLKKMLINNFESNLRIAGLHQLKLPSRVVYDRIVDLFLLLSRACVEQGDGLDGQVFTIKDLEVPICRSCDVYREKHIYFKELDYKILLELEQIKFLKSLSEMSVWQSIAAILKLMKTNKQPFGIVA